MNTQDSRPLTYNAPKASIIMISTRFGILQGSITPYEEGSSSDNDGFGYDME